MPRTPRRHRHPRTRRHVALPAPPFTSAEEARSAMNLLLAKVEGAPPLGDAPSAAPDPDLRALLARAVRHVGPETNEHILEEAYLDATRRVREGAIARFKAYGNEIVRRLWSEEHAGDEHAGGPPRELLFEGADAAALPEGYSTNRLLSELLACFDPERLTAHEVGDILEAALARAHHRRAAN